VGDREGAVEDMVGAASFWDGKRVFITGHTGFKGAWLALWLSDLGAEVTGYALPPPTTPSLYDLANVGSRISNVEADIRDLATLVGAVREARPEVVFHLAAQSLVRLSYDDPVGTYAANVMGTVNLLEAVRRDGGARAVVCVTSDKCYENRETSRAYREDDAMGGHDPYSSSKGCSELVVSAYRRSFFSPTDGVGDVPRVASVRAGNVIGGGDWAKDRLVPDLLNGFAAGSRPRIRFPTAIRPWQHVFEPLDGYLTVARRLWSGDPSVDEGWNFGPDETDARPVGWIADRLAELWGNNAGWDRTGEPQPHEAHVLKLNCTKARERLGWKPVWALDEGLRQTVAWRRALEQGAEMGEFSLNQLRMRQTASTDA
jgi:CDP-glucose 4,6-dehydratase